MSSTKPKVGKINVRPATKKLIDQHSKSRGMTRLEFADRAIRAFIQQADQQPQQPAA